MDNEITKRCTAQITQCDITWDHSTDFTEEWKHVQILYRQHKDPNYFQLIIRYHLPNTASGYTEATILTWRNKRQVTFCDQETLQNFHLSGFTSGIGLYMDDQEGIYIQLEVRDVGAIVTTMDNSFKYSLCVDLVGKQPTRSVCIAHIEKGIDHVVIRHALLPDGELTEEVNEEYVHPTNW